MRAVLISLGGLAGFAVIVAFWGGYFYWAYHMIHGRKKGVRPFGKETLWNPFNLVFFPQLLTPEGLRARKWFFVCIFGFIVSLFAMAGFCFAFGE